MFEREIKFIYDFNLNKINKLGPYFTFEQLTTVGLHPAILNYISAELNYIIFEDRQKLLKNSIFDYSGETITHYFNLITEEVRRTKRLSFEYVSKLILHASSFTINFLVRPNWTLLKFVFDEEEHKTANEIKQILNYLYYYNYLRKILISYLNSKKIISINSQEFEELLKKVDKLGSETYLQSIISTALKSMTEYFNIGEVKKNKIPLQAIDLFLEEKKLFEHKFKLIEVFGDDKSQKLSIKDIQKTLNFVMLEKQEEFPLFSSIKEDMIEEPIEPIENEETVTTDNTQLEIEEEAAEQIENDIKPTTPNRQLENVDDEELKIVARPQKYRIKVDEEIQIEPVENEKPIVRSPEDDVKDKTEIENHRFDEDKTILKEDFVKDNLEVVDETSGNDIIEERAENDNVFEEVAQHDEAEEFEDTELLGTVEDNGNKEEDEITESMEIESEENEEEEEIHFSNFAFNLPEEIKHDYITDEEEIINDTTDMSVDNTKEKVKVNEQENVDEQEKSMLKSILNVEQNEVEEDVNNKNINEVDAESEIDKSGLANSYVEEQNSKIDLSELLEHKDMTRIIEVIFDYDIEEFASTLEEISASNNLNDAIVILNQTLKNHNVSRNSKEAEAFKSIISEYYNRS